VSVGFPVVGKENQRERNRVREGGEEEKNEI
jgi:hypothetical protein